VRNELWRRARATPSLDLRFAEAKSLQDAVSGQSLVTFTRASSATYVDSDGLIKTAATNLLLRSEEFDNASWIKTASSVSANAAASPSGTLTGDRLIENSANAQHIAYVGALATASAVHTFSVYAKAAERSQVFVRLDTNVNTRQSSFDLLAGTVLAQGGGCTASVSPAGNGWHRCSVTLSAAESVINAVVILGNGGSSSYTGDGTSGIYLWGAQLEVGTVATEYLPTGASINSAPRFQHDPTTGACLGLLVEEQRANLLTGSQDFSNTYWPQSGSVRTNNNAAAPDATTTACLVAGNGSSFGGLTRKQTFVFSASTTYSFTCFAKAGTHDHIGLRITASCIAANGVDYCRFNLATGIATAITPTAGTVVSVSMQPLPNGWHRCSMVYTTSASQPGTGDIVDIALVANTGSHNYTGTGNAYLWGAQLEAGAFPTSYIKTEGTSATRSADIPTITGANFSSWYRQDEGTVFAETQLQSIAARIVAGFDINDTSTNNRIVFRALTASVVDQATIRSASSTVFSPANVSPAPTTATRKSAVAYKANDFMFTAVGSAGYTGATGAVPVGVSQMLVGYEQGPAGYLGGTISRLTYWPQRLPNSTLQTLTT
jgi:hypothetical protein